MKIVEDIRAMVTPMTEVKERVERIILSKNTLTCSCGRIVYYHEACITQQHDNILLNIVKQYHKALEDITEAIETIYGEDIRAALLFKKMTQIQKDLHRPKLELVKQEGRKNESKNTDITKCPGTQKRATRSIAAIHNNPRGENAIR